MPFFRTRVTMYRPYSGLIPLGITKLIAEAETEAPDSDTARKKAAEQAVSLSRNIDHVTRTVTEII